MSTKLTNELLYEDLRDAVLTKVGASKGSGLTLTEVIDDVFAAEQRFPRYRVREAVLDLLFVQELKHDARGIVHLAANCSGESTLRR